MAKPTIWYILKKSILVSSETPKGPEDHGKTTMVDDRRIFPLLKKKLSTKVGLIENTLQEVGIYVSKLTIERKLCQSKCRGFGIENY